MNDYKCTNQIGYTCGLYCIIIADCILNKKNFNLDIYYDFIKKCVDSSLTKVGEVFDITVLEKIAKSFMPNINMQIYDTKSVTDLKMLLENNIIIMPVVSCNTPHYTLMCKSKKYVQYNSFPFGKHILFFSKILKSNNSISDKYVWPKKIISPSPYSKLYDSILNTFIKNGKYRKRYSKEIFNTAVNKNIIQIGDVDEVNMRGKFLLLSKTTNKISE